MIDDKTANQAERQQSIKPTLVAINEQGSYQEVVEKEKQQVDGKMTPYNPYFLPVECQFAVASTAT